MVRRQGAVALNGLPPGEFPTSTFDVVLKRVTIVGTRKDRVKNCAIAAEGAVKTHIYAAALEETFDNLGNDKIHGPLGHDILNTTECGLNADCHGASPKVARFAVHPTVIWPFVAKNYGAAEGLRLYIHRRRRRQHIAAASQRKGGTCRLATSEDLEVKR
jgi:hypothetical protein